jgi:hypothetical protein
MKTYPILIIPVLTFTLCSCSNNDPGPQFAGWNYEHMTMVKKSIRNNSSPYYPAYESLKKEADNSLERGPYSVTFKKNVPPGGTKNDYMSQGPYWWPDTSKPDGLPYIRRDGVRNPESGIDRTQLGNLISSVDNLSIAWYFTGDTKYADKAVSLLRVWFIEPETMMNPHLEFGQSIPGITSGRGIGIIDVRGMHTLVDAISLLERSGALAPDETEQIKKWFSDFFVWLTTSSHGKDEDNYFNNHAVAYDVIVSSIAIFLGNEEYAFSKISQIPARRIDKMIEADGRQPEELVRTNAFGYSVSNLRNFFDAGETGLKVGVNIFGYTTPEGGSLQKALDFLIKYIGKKSEWEWEQISGWEQAENGLGLLIRSAGRHYNKPEYKTLWENTFSERMKSDWSLLVTPDF